MINKLIAESCSRRRRSGQLLSATLALAGSAAAAILSAPVEAALRPYGALSCSKVSATEIKKALGITVGTTKVTTVGSSTTCTYTHSTMTVKISAGFSSASFTTDRKSFDSHGEPTKTVSGLGSSAFSSTIGSGSYATNTVVVLKGSTELLITATQVNLAKVEGLAKTVLSAI
jgi:hypothetical protein